MDERDVSKGENLVLARRVGVLRGNEHEFNFGFVEFEVDLKH